MKSVQAIRLHGYNATNVCVCIPLSCANSELQSKCDYTWSHVVVNVSLSGLERLTTLLTALGRAWTAGKAKQRIVWKHFTIHAKTHVSPHFRLNTRMTAIYKPSESVPSS